MRGKGEKRTRREEKREINNVVRDYYRIGNNVTMGTGAQIISGVSIINVTMSSIVIITNTIRLMEEKVWINKMKVGGRGITIIT